MKKTGAEAEKNHIAELEKARIECGARAREAMVRDLETRRRRKEWAEGVWLEAPRSAETRSRLVFGFWIPEADLMVYGPDLFPYLLLELRQAQKRRERQWAQG